jgi:hypothetical protein
MTASATSLVAPRVIAVPHMSSAAIELTSRREFFKSFSFLTNMKWGTAPFRKWGTAPFALIRY